AGDLRAKQLLEDVAQAVGTDDGDDELHIASRLPLTRPSATLSPLRGARGSRCRVPFSPPAGRKCREAADEGRRIIRSCHRATESLLLPANTPPRRAA